MFAAFLAGVIAAGAPVAVYVLKQASALSIVVIFHPTVLQYETVNTTSVLLSFV